MLYPHARIPAGEPQVIFDGPPDALTTARDERVRQFVEGEAKERLSEEKAEE
jgi:phospholipid/cholesterol/gamma-HCH transport system ATP-binding protein